MSKPRLQGIFTPHMVPLDARGEINEPELRRYIVWLIASGVHGLYPNGSTGEFKDIYSQSASQLRQVLIDNKAMSKGTIIDSAVKSASKTKVDVVLFVDQWITNVASPQPRLDRSRVAMTMELIDGKWLESKVELK